MSVLQLNNVKKTYEDHLAVKDISFDVPKASIFGLLGPNGAGKTTLIRMITGITQPDSGQILLNGHPTTGILNRGIGYLPEERGLYKKMKVAEHLIYLGRLKGLSYNTCTSRIRSWLEKFDLMDWRKRQVGELSKGMQQKIQFIATVLPEPDLLILDEPFSGLDPVNTNLIKSEILRLKENGTSIIFSTHRMEQVEVICERIVLINNGEKVLEGEVDQIKQEHKNHHFAIQVYGQLPENLGDGVEVLEREKNELIFSVDHNLTPNEVVKRIIEQGVQIRSFREVLPTLNEVFIKRVS